MLAILERRSIITFMELYAEDSADGLLISMHSCVERIAARIWNLPMGLILKGPHPDNSK